MSNKYIIEKLSCNETYKIAPLYSISFGKATSANAFKWKYFDNPSGKPLCLGAKDKENLIGAFTLVPEDFYVFGDKSKVYKCNDLMVHPEYRGQGLGSKLVRSVSEHLKQSGSLFIYTFCAKYVSPFFFNNKWQKLYDVEYFFKHKAHLKAKFVFKKFEKLFNNRTLRRIKSISELCKNYEFKIDNTKIHIIKDEKYFNWRLKDPRFKYDIIGYYKRNSLEGYIIYNSGINNNKFIIDLEAQNGNLGIINTLISSVEFSAYNNYNKSVIALTVKGSPFQKLIKKNKYIRNPFHKGPLTSTMDFNILINSNYNDELSNKLNWDIYPLSYDAV